MAARGTSKARSVEQEEMVARKYDGVRSKSSGGAAHDQGDVRCAGVLIECKMTMKPPKKLIEEMEKVTQEAFSEGREPMLALRWWAPESILADADGWIDLSVRRMCDDTVREDRIRDLEGACEEVSACAEA